MSKQTVGSRGVFIGEVVANNPLCDEHYLIRLRFCGFPPTKPGQFVQIQCRGLGEQPPVAEVAWPKGEASRFTQTELTGSPPLLRRPFSLAGRRDGKHGQVELDIIYRAIGRGTRYLAALAPRARLSVLGPLGNSFGILADRPLAVLVGGGAGAPPLLYLAGALAAANKRTFAFCGARSARLLPLKLTDHSQIPKQPVPTLCAAQLAAYGIPVVVATDDGSVGCAGMVSEIFQDWLEAGAEDASKLVVYCCGPQAMMRTVAERCASQDIKCQLAMERLMACGMGTCQSCIVKVRDAGQRGWSYKLCCADGPIFDAGELLWD